MSPAASRPHSGQKTVSTPWMFDELKGGRKEVTLSAFCPTPGWKGGLLSLFGLCAGRRGRAQNLSVSPSSQVPLCTFSFFGLIESDKLKYLEKPSSLEKCPLRPCTCVFLSPGVHPILMLMIPKFGSTLWTPRGPRPCICLPFRHLLLDAQRLASRVCSQLPPACSLAVSSDLWVAHYTCPFSLLTHSVCIWLSGICFPLCLLDHYSRPCYLLLDLFQHPFCSPTPQPPTITVFLSWSQKV